MFNVELPPDSSWKWQTGITTPDQNEIQNLESQLSEANERIAELEAEVARLRKALENDLLIIHRIAL